MSSRSSTESRSWGVIATLARSVRCNSNQVQLRRSPWLPSAAPFGRGFVVAARHVRKTHVDDAHQLALLQLREKRGVVGARELLRWVNVSSGQHLDEKTVAGHATQPIASSEVGCVVAA